MNNTQNVTKIAYKVFRLSKGKKFSAIEKGPWQVNYENDGWITPPHGANPFLFVFSTLKFAKQFVERHGFPKNGFLIKRVIADGVTTKTLSLSGKKFEVDIFPEGTLFCQRLMIVRNTVTVYKATRKIQMYNSISPSFMSAISRYSNVEYGIGKVTIPKKNENQFLFVFRTEQAARKFRPHMNYTISKAKAYNVSSKSLDKSGYTFTTNPYPAGTRFAQAVELVETL